jgi:hypothetical protein
LQGVAADGADPRRGNAENFRLGQDLYSIDRGDRNDDPRLAFPE